MLRKIVVPAFLVGILIAAVMLANTTVWQAATVHKFLEAKSMEIKQSAVDSVTFSGGETTWFFSISSNKAFSVIQANIITVNFDDVNDQVLLSEILVTDGSDTFLNDIPDTTVKAAADTSDTKITIDVPFGADANEKVIIKFTLDSVDADDQLLVSWVLMTETGATITVSNASTIAGL